MGWDLIWIAHTIYHTNGVTVFSGTMLCSMLDSSSILFKYVHLFPLTLSEWILVHQALARKVVDISKSNDMDKDTRSVKSCLKNLEKGQNLGLKMLCMKFLDIWYALLTVKNLKINSSEISAIFFLNHPLVHHTFEEFWTTDKTWCMSHKNHYIWLILQQANDMSKTLPTKHQACILLGAFCILSLSFMYGRH